MHTYVVSACLILLAASTWLQRYLKFSCSSHFKSRLLKMTTTAMTVEFGTFHDYSSMEENAQACLCSPLNTK